MRSFFGLAIAAMALVAVAGTAQARSTLDEVKARGSVRCGVTELGPALGSLSPEGRWIGFYPEFCRAVAAATTGNAENVDFIMVSTSDRFDALRLGAVDMLSEATTFTLGRNAMGMEFPAIVFHDGQGFLTYRGDNMTSAADLDGKRVCVQGAATSEGNLLDFMATSDMTFEVMTFSTIEGAYSAFFGRQCEAMSTDSLILGSMRMSMAPEPADYILFDERISHEPISPAVRDDDAQWVRIVRWTIHAMFQAEVLGITQDNADAMRADGPLEARRLMGADSTNGAALGLDEAWAWRVIKQVGNYAEVYDRTIGPASDFGLARGRNALIRDGGLLWAPPLR